MSDVLYPWSAIHSRTMIFVDGENLAMCYGRMLGGVPAPANMTGWYIPDVAVWSIQIDPGHHVNVTTDIVRKYYFTSVCGDENKRDETTDWLKEKGFEMPRVFRRDKERGSKQVDVSLSVAMLVGATRRHYDVAVLVAGDEDYIPLVKAVQAEGARVHLWFVSNGLSPRLRREVDYFACLDGCFYV